MKTPQIGDRIRLTENLIGEVVKIQTHPIADKIRVKFEYKKTRGKGQVVRGYSRSAPLIDAMPAADQDQKDGIRWRLRYFLQEGLGRKLEANASPHNISETSRKPWTPWSPEG